MLKKITKPVTAIDALKKVKEKGLAKKHSETLYLRTQSQGRHTIDLLEERGRRAKRKR